MFEEPVKLVLGLVTGIVFGVLLQKGQVAKFHTVLGQLLLKDSTVVKIMGTAVAVGSVGVYLLVENGVASLHIQPAVLARLLIGATLFGIGLAVFGLCPGTSVAASGEGQRDAMVGVLVMFTGAAVYVALYAWLEPIFKSMPDWGKVTVAKVTDTSPWIWITSLAIAALAMWAMKNFHRPYHHHPVPG